MNWFTRTCHANSSLERKKKALADEGGCEHCEKDPSLVVAQHWERDSFGPVSSNAVCQECEDKIAKATEEEPHVCKDCKETFPRKEGRMYKWYGFSYREGDEELFICTPCTSLPTHQGRLTRDRREAAYDDEEFS